MAAAFSHVLLYVVAPISLSGICNKETAPATIAHMSERQSSSSIDDSSFKSNVSSNTSVVKVVPKAA